MHLNRCSWKLYNSASMLNKQQINPKWKSRIEIQETQAMMGRRHKAPKIKNTCMSTGTREA